MELENQRRGVVEVNRVERAALHGRVGRGTRHGHLGGAQRADDRRMRAATGTNLHALDVGKRLDGLAVVQMVRAGVGLAHDLDLVPLELILQIFRIEMLGRGHCFM